MVGNMTFLNTDAKIATHAAISQNVHGVGANDIADVADISTHADVTTNVHGTGAGNVVVGDDKLLNTLTDVTSSRSVDTIYQNTSGGVMLVIITCDSTSSTNFYIYTAPTTPPGIKTGASYQQIASGEIQLTTFVPEGWYYKFAVAAGTPGIDAWFELTI